MYITYVSCVINILFLYFALKYTYMQKKEGWEGRQTERVRGKEKERVQCHLHQTSFVNLQNVNKRLATFRHTNSHTNTQTHKHKTHNPRLGFLQATIRSTLAHRHTDIPTCVYI